MSGIVNVRGARSGVIGTVTGTTVIPAAGGITHHSQWVIDTEVTATDIVPYQNWTQRSLYGDALTEDDGIFTFPVTGWWQILFTSYGTMDVAGYVNTSIEETQNNSTYTVGAFNTSSHPAGHYQSHDVGPYFFDVTDEDNFKVRFVQGATQNYHLRVGTISGEASDYNSGATFVRLGDT